MKKDKNTAVMKLLIRTKRANITFLAKVTQLVYKVGFLTILSIQVLHGQKAKVFQDENYTKYKLNPDTVEKWEDGLRTDPSKRGFEWWYFDAKINEGKKDETTVVVVFYTKNFLSPKRGANPYITVNVNRADKAPLQRIIRVRKNDFSASKDSCNVTIGKNYFRYKKDHYTIHVEEKDSNGKELLKLDIDLYPKTPGWRPKTGHTIFKNAGRENYFAWVVAVPKGKVKIHDLSYWNKAEGKKVSIQGTGEGYHDHNWGDKGIHKLYNHWYWGRSNDGKHTVIAAYMIPNRKYGSQEQVVFHVFKGESSISKDQIAVRVKRDKVTWDKESGKDISNSLTFLYSDASNPNRSLKYEYSLEVEKIIAKSDFLEVILSRDPSSPRKGLAYYITKLFTGFNAHYFRFLGKTDLIIEKDGQRSNTETPQKAVWELMYLGKPLKKQK